MYRWQLAVAAVVLIGGWEVAMAQTNDSVTTTQLADHIYKLSYHTAGYAVNMVASVGADGVLLVDTGEREYAEQVKAAVDSLGHGAPSFIINTHAHVDHTGGNAIFGQAPVIVAHEILRTRLRSGSYLLDEFPDEALPDIGFTDSMSLYFNGEEIRLVAYPGSHDDCDIIVWFAGSGIVCAGDIATGHYFPSYEEVTGSLLGYEQVLNQLIADLPDDVTIVSGHGAECGPDGLAALRDMIVQTSAVVREKMAAGMDLAAMTTADVLADWASFEGSYVGRNEYLAGLYDALQGGSPQRTIYEPVYYALRDDGIEAAVAKYYELKRDSAADYRFVETDLAFMVDKLSRHERFPEAIRFTELFLSEYPGGQYAWYSYYSLGKMYTKLGDTASAVKNYRLALEHDPGEARYIEAIQEKLRALGE